MKIAITDRDSWMRFRAQWSRGYGKLSKDIITLKKLMGVKSVSVPRIVINPPSGVELSSLQSYRARLGNKATKMMADLDKAKESRPKQHACRLIKIK